MSQASDPATMKRAAPRRARGVVIGVLLLAAGAGLAAGGGWYGWRWYTRPVPPALALTEDDPEVAAAVEAARQRLRREPYAVAAWGDLGELLRAAEYREPAAACFLQAERLAPADPRWPYLAAEAVQQRDPDAALAHLRRAVGLYRRPNANAIPALLRLSEVLLTKGRYDEAETHLRQALDLDPDNPSILLDLGLAASGRDDLKGSRELLRRAENSPFTRQKACAELAAVCQRLGDEAAAADYGRRAAALPHDAHWPDPLLMESLQAERGRPSRFHAVERLEAQGRYPEAVAKLRDLVADDPNPRAYVGLGKNLERLGDYPAAEGALRTALELAPDSAQAYYYLAKVTWVQAEQRWRQEGEREQALAGFRAAAEHARQALARKPDHALAHMLLGLCLRRLGRRGEALDALRLAVQCGSELPDPHLYYGEVLAEAGREAEARAQLEQATRVARPDDPRPREALAKLNAAGKK